MIRKKIKPYQRKYIKILFGKTDTTNTHGMIEGTEEWINHYLDTKWIEEKYGINWDSQIPKEIINHYKAEVYYSILTAMAFRDISSISNKDVEEIQLFFEELQIEMKDMIDKKINHYLHHHDR